MHFLTSELLEPFDDPRPWIQLSRPQTSINDGDAEKDTDTDIHKGGPRVVIDGTKQRKLSARERLDKLSTFRIYLNALNFNSSGLCGRGGKAEVVKATLRRRIWNFKTHVAVKKLGYHRGMNKHRFSNEFAHEVELMAGLSHRNIIQLIGFVEDFDNGQAWIILSWEPNGNVSEFLGTGRWEIPERISLIQDTFEGLKYLHTRQPPICHGDLKSLNILVSSSYRAIITDFGSARVLRGPANPGTSQRRNRPVNDNPAPEEECSRIHITTTGNQLTLTGPAWSLRWAPPEVVNGNSAGLPSDIWSAGWVCWEVMTDKLPFPELDSGTAITLRVIEGKVPSANEEERLSQIVRLCSLMTDCWILDPEDRPTISRCCDEVKWVPSLPPLGGIPPDTKVGTSRLLLQMGRMHFLHARYENAVALFQEVEAAAQDDSSNERAEALHWLGNVSAARCEYREAEEFFTRAQDIYARVDDDLGQADALQGLAGVYQRQNDLVKAERSFIRAQNIYNKHDENRGQASTLCGLGYVYHAQRNYGQAEKTFTKAQEIYSCIGDGQGLANTLQGLGSVYRLQLKLTEAHESFSRAHSIYARIGDDEGRANALVELGNVYCAGSKFDEAKSSFTQALEINTKISNVQGQANSWRGMGEVYRNQPEYGKAEQCYIQASNAYDRIGDAIGRGNALSELGEVYLYQSKHSEAASAYNRAAESYHHASNYTAAESCYTQAQDAYDCSGNRVSQANALYGLGEVYHDQSKYTEAASSYTRAGEVYLSLFNWTKAEKCYTQAHDACNRVGYNQGLAIASYGLGEVYRHQSKHDHAVSSYLRAGEFYHSRFNFTEAEKCYTQAKDVYNHVGNAEGQIHALSKLRMIYGYQDKYTEAASSFVLAGEIYHSRYDYTKAKSSFIAARKIYSHIRNDDGQANALYALGEIYYYRFRFSKAESYYIAAKELYASINNDEGQARALCRLGEVYCRECNYTQAESCYTQAKDAYARISNDEGQKKALEGLGELRRQ